MAAKKEIRSDNTYIISTENTDNPKLGAKILSDGRESLFLDYHLGTRTIYDEAKAKVIKKKDRKREYLKLYLWRAPRTAQEKQQNKDTIELARKIRFESEQERKDGMLGYRLKAKEVNFFDFLQSYYDNYTKGDVRMIKAAKKRFTDFITLKYPLYMYNIPPQRITPDMMLQFVDYLKDTSEGDGAASHWKRWKKIINAAVRQEILIKSPCKDIVCRSDDGALKKEILSKEEIRQLKNTDYKGLNAEVKKAFCLTLHIGIRFCDVKELTFANVDYSNRLLTYIQKKTQIRVQIKLTDYLLSLIGTASTGAQNEKIFKLPSQEGCLKALRNWVKAAGIEKHITWHSGRHTCATTLAINGVDIKTIAAILGHASIRHTEKYLRVVDSLKEDAIKSLED